MRMWVYVLRRLILVLPVIVGVMTITFVLVSGIPTPQRFLSYCGPPPRHGGGEAFEKYQQHCSAVLGLNKPVYTQWAIYMFNTLTFQWGHAENDTAAVSALPFIQGQPVATILGWLLPYTMELGALALFLILVIALPLGRISAANRNRPVDQAARVLSFSGYAIPSYLLGSLTLIAIVLVLSNLHWYGCGGPFTQFYGSWPQAGCMAGSSPANLNFPTWLKFGVISTPTGFPTLDAAIHGQWWLALDTVVRLLIPAVIVAYGAIAFLLRFVRNSMLEVMNLEFVRTARAKGVVEDTVVKRHAGRNSLNVTVTVLGLTFAGFIGGFPIVEEVFGLYGVGRILAVSVLAPYDYGLIFGSTILFTWLVVIANISVDLVYAQLDPRVRLG